MSSLTSVEKCRHADHAIDSLFLDRWSPRAMTGEALPQETVLTLIEAARWAPSGGNGQPWRFFYALAGTPAFSEFFNLLVPTNRAWAGKAGALFVIASRTLQENNGKPHPSHAFDAGAAWMSFALQGSLKGLAVHGIGGFDKVKATEVLSLPPEYQPQAMAVVGFPAAAETLSEPLREREIPSKRKPLSEIAFEGGWPAGKLA